MASITTRPNGDRWVQWTRSDRTRATLRCGSMPMSMAREIKRHVEMILIARETGSPVPLDTARWISSTEGTIRERLAGAGLVAAQEELASTLRELSAYARQRYADNPKNTRRNIERSITALHDFFGEGRRLDRFTTADADEFRQWLRRQQLAETTITGICKKAKTIFALAVDKEWLALNPFRRLKGWTHTDISRRHFVDRPTIEKLIAKCEPEWQLIIALARYGGVQAPMEMLDLRWEWIDLPGGRFQVYKRKNIHSKPYREVPIFPELRPHLEAAYDRNQRGETHLIQSHRTEKGLYSALRKRLDRAAINPWPKLFVNMRSSLETELMERFPIHVVAYWLGNSPTVANAHYLQITPDHFSRALESASEPPPVAVPAQ